MRDVTCLSQNDNHSQQQLVMVQFELFC